MLSAYVALALQRAPLLIVRGFAVVAAVYASVVTALAIFTPHGGFSTGAAQRPGLPPLFTAWTAAIIGTAAAVWLLGRRQRHREDHTTATV
jgi:lipopolysaccharide export LptBFGC system permease protein LptF